LALSALGASINAMMPKHKKQEKPIRMVPMKFLLLGLVLRTQSSQVHAFASSPLIANSIVSGKMSSSSSALNMARTRGLERQEEGATPLRKFAAISLMNLYLVIIIQHQCFRRLNH
jgi:hypothetical protein